MKLFHQLFGAIFPLLAAQIVTDLQDRHQVVINAQATENRGFLRQIADPPARARVQRQQADVFVINDNIARVARHNPDHHVEGGGFTGAVGAKQADNLPRVNGETDIFHHAAAFIRFSEILRS